MVKTVFKIIFLIVMFLGIVAMIVTPLFFPKDSRNDVSTNRKITKIRLIAMIVSASALLIVLLIR